MTYYSLLSLIPATLEPAEVENTQQKILGILEKNRAEIKKKHEPEKRKLAYTIKHVRHGIYLNIDFDMAGENIKNLKKDLGLISNLLRFNLTKEKYSENKQTKHRKRIPPQQNIQEEDAQTLKEKTQKETKINLDELNKKLDEILDD